MAASSKKWAVKNEIKITNFIFFEESTGERIVSRRDSNGSLKENILSTMKRRDGSGPIKRPRASFENSSLQTFEMSSVKKRREETQSLLRQLSECDSNRCVIIEIVRD